MQVQTRTWSPDSGWSAELPGTADPQVQLILSFGPADAPDPDWFSRIGAVWPAATHVYCSGGGQITEGFVHDDTTVVTAISFATVGVHVITRNQTEIDRSTELGADIGESMASIDALRHVLVFAEGISLNGAAFVRGLNAALPASVGVSGGLASNGPALTRSVVGVNGPPTAGTSVAVGLSGDALEITTGSVGGWDIFGPERIVSRSHDTVVYELDGENALDVYRRYLGDFARELPGIALLFPLTVWQTDGPITVRTILGIDEEAGTLRFAGDVPQGSIVRLMRTTTDKLIDGAAQAAQLAHDGAATTPGLTLCVSCIGRRAVMRSRVEEELDEVVLVSRGSPVIGFYGNGEIAPPTDGRTFAQAVLHNQTMTVTTIGER